MISLMNWNIFFFTAILLCISMFGHRLGLTPAYATSVSSEYLAGTPELPENPKKKEYFGEAHNVYLSCMNDYSLEKAYDCKCIASKLFETRMDSNNFFTSQEIITDAMPECKNSPKLAYRYYEQCLSWAAATRRDSHEFCTCYGNSMGRSFELKTFHDARVEESLIKMAYKECGFATPYTAEQRNERIKKDLKKRGLLERLFPSFWDTSDEDK